MRHAVVPFSQLATTGRWDAPFHVNYTNAMREHGELVQRLLKTDIEQLRKHAMNLPFNEKAMDTVRRGCHPGRLYKSHINKLKSHDLALYVAMAMCTPAEVQAEAQRRIDSINRDTRATIESINALFSPGTDAGND